MHIVGCLGVYRTPAEDMSDPTRVCDTIKLCYMGVLTGDQEIRYDTDHTNARWMSAAELSAGSCGYWYPEHVARLALDIYQSSPRGSNHRGKVTPACDNFLPSGVPRDPLARISCRNNGTF